MRDAIKAFNPSGYAVDNGNLVGLPFTEEEAKVVLLPAPWEVTVSSGSGTLNGADNIRKASLQLDLYDEQIEEAWKMGIYFRPTNTDWHSISRQLKLEAEEYIDFLESGGVLEESPKHQEILSRINQQSQRFTDWMRTETQQLLEAGKLVGVIGGEHSVPLGYLQALATKHEEFGILQIDAHCDLRAAYEGFTHSHASIFYNALAIPNISKITQVGIRDYCEEEVTVAKESQGRVAIMSDVFIKNAQFEGVSFKMLTRSIIDTLPQKVYVSFDIDGLKPDLCPHTGTPVPGGLEFQEAMYLLMQLVESGRTIIGFDVSEVNGEFEWDGNVGARVVYKLSNLMGISSNA